jgi:hypothetical protein
MPPQNFSVAEPPSTWALSCTALAIAESLGVNLDSSQWRLPKKEHQLRRRLWWLTYVQHVWHALLLGRPSHINDDNWDVSIMTVQDFDTMEDYDQEFQHSVDELNLVFVANCDLTIIASHILKDL